MQNIVALFVAVFLMTASTQAQKLPSAQQGSFAAPKDIKIDGKPTEWQNTFQAYNDAVDFSYTVANDADNLYFAIQAKYHGTIQKIVAGGITFTIRSSDKKSEQVPVAITYPIVPTPYDAGVNYTLRTTDKFTDEELSKLNTQVSGHIKDIPVSGIKQVPDSIISLYNDVGIKAAGLIDHQKAYTCEAAIPLKYIQHLLNTSGTFKYRLQVNGLDVKSTTTKVVVGSRVGVPTDGAVDQSSAYFLLTPTYFDGVYTLAK